MAQNIFFNKGEKSYYYVCTDEDKEVFCDICHEVVAVGDYIFIQRSFSRHTAYKFKFCHICISQHRKRIYDEFITAEVSDVIPHGSDLFIETPPLLKTAGNLTVFEAALEDDGADVISRCKLSFKDNSDHIGYQENKTKSEERIEELDKTLKTDNQVIGFLDNIGQPIIQIETKDTKQIEDKKNI